MRINLLELAVGDRIPGDFRKPAREPIALDGPLDWTIWVTEPQRESATAKRIRDDLGLKPYVAVEHRKVAAGRGRKKWIEVSMLPSRIFVPMPRHFRAWNLVLGTRGIRDYLRQAGETDRPAVVAAPDVEQLRKLEARIDAKYRRELAVAEESPYRRGRPVWVEILPARKTLGKIDGTDRRGRIEVELEEEILGRKIWPVVPHLVQFADN